MFIVNNIWLNIFFFHCKITMIILQKNTHTHIRHISSRSILIEIKFIFQLSISVSCVCASAGPSGSRQSIQIDLYFSCFVLFTLALWPPQRCELNFLNIFIMHVYEYESLTDGSFKMFNFFFPILIFVRYQSLCRYIVVMRPPGILFNPNAVCC